MWKIDSFKASWKECFSILIHDMGILLLVSMRTLMSVYRAVMHSLIFVGTFVGVLAMGSALGTNIFLAIFMCAFFYLALLVIAARPSLKKKNSLYWVDYIGIDWLFSGLFVGLVLLGDSLSQDSFFRYFSDAIATVLLASEVGWLFDYVQLNSMVIFYSPFIILSILFVCDSKSLVRDFFRSVGRAALMFTYNYPFFLVVYMLFRLIVSSFFLLLLVPLPLYIPLRALIFFIFLFVMFPYYVCLITNFYVKRLHEQFSLYYAR